MEFGGALEADVSALFAGGFFAFEEEGEAVFEGEFADVGHGELFFEGLCHAGQSEFVEQVERGFSEHWSVFFLGLKYLRVFTDGRRSVWSGRRQPTGESRKVGTRTEGDISSESRSGRVRLTPSTRDS